MQMRDSVNSVAVDLRNKLDVFLIKRFMRYFIIILIGIYVCSCNNAADQSIKTMDTNNVTAAPEIEDTSLSKNIKEARYGISIKLPTSWKLKTVKNNHEPASIIMYPESIDYASKSFGLHGDASFSYIIIYPEGLGTELPFSDSRTFKQAEPDLQLPFEVSLNDSRIFLLENKNVWAYFIVPQTPPVSWKHGFVFAQIGVDEFSQNCFGQDGLPKDSTACDPLSGDIVVRKGKIRTATAATVRRILNNIQLKEDSTYTSVNNLIKVDSPTPKSSISSPLTITGSARGYWYFEADFPIFLLDGKGNKIATAIAQAKGNWMTKDYVPFEATMEFVAPASGGGELKFENSNPSGLEENARSLTIPVRFKKH